MTQYTKNNSALVAVIGLDQPGIVATVSSALTRLGCNIEEMTQSTLHDQFSGIYLLNKPEGLSNETLNEEISKALEARKFHLSLEHCHLNVRQHPSRSVTVGHKRRRNPFHGTYRPETREFILPLR